MVHISTEYAQQYVLQTLGPSAVAHMLYRFEPAAGLIQPSTLETDYNIRWSGYVSDLSGSSHKVNLVTGTWHVVQPGCTSCSILATWIGIGGWHSTNNLIQTGVTQNTLQAWIELLPAGSQNLFTTTTR
jgi:hypothetical protein